MRHIPDDELHAYLDQALSRSQCVEIESHLASCAHCQAERDGIAALRDRTTALLSSLAPPRRFTPSVELLREQAEARSARRAERLRAAAWAASVLVAVGLGWAGKSMLEGVPARASEITAAPLVSAPATVAIDSAVPMRAPMRAPTLASNPAISPTRERSTVPTGSTVLTASTTAPTDPPIGPPPRIEPVATVLSSGQLLDPNFDGATGTVFRTVSWDNAQRERGAAVPRIAGLPVMQVQVGSSEGRGKPLVVVAQQLESGQVIRTIEGPATDVNKLLASQGGDAGSPWPTMGDSAGIAGGNGAMAVRRGDRILAITAPLSSDSLRAMIRRLNVTER